MTGLKTFDFAVANPPFSLKAWTSGFDPTTTSSGASSTACPPAKNGDYAFLLHILIASLKSTGKAAVILPHGVLFRGNKEADIRRNLIKPRPDQGDHRPAGQPVLRHGHPRLHRGARQGERPRPHRHLHGRRQQGVSEGRQQEPAAVAGHPQDRRRLQPQIEVPRYSPHGAGRARSPIRRTTTT